MPTISKCSRRRTSKSRCRTLLSRSASAAYTATILNDLSLDTKPQKEKARMMLDMVRDINAKFGDGKTHVTCWTCHHASTKPQVAKASSN